VAPAPATVSEAYPGRRFAQIIKLRPECVAEYKKVHAAVWPEVLKQIKDCNIVDCA
jgi:L-rhamnose mutarotase